MSQTDIPTRILRIEGAVALVAAVLLWGLAGVGSWLVFALAFFVPDVSMIGYLKGPRVGALAYNMAHTYTAPALLALVGLAGAPPAVWRFAIVWAAHIGFDRLVGYGLKHPTGFRDTHLGSLGWAAGSRPRSPEPPPRRRH